MQEEKLSRKSSMQELFPEFEKIEAMMNGLVDEIVRQSREKVVRYSQPLQVGMTIKINNRGQTSVEHKSVVPVPIAVSSEKHVAYNASEPMTQVQESRDAATITMEMPGVAAEDINVYFFSDTSLVIEAKNKEAAFFKEVNLQSKVVQESLEQNYNNNVLEITLAKESKSTVQ